jgi:hypothetical protein
MNLNSRFTATSLKACTLPVLPPMPAVVPGASNSNAMGDPATFRKAKMDFAGVNL